MNLRQQLQLKRTLRNLRTWAPPISVGVIIGAGAFMFVERLDSATAMEAAEHAAPRTASYSALPHTPASTYYRNCAAARADGASSIHAGAPGYAPHLDRDNDGVACEPYPR